MEVTSCSASTCGCTASCSSCSPAWCSLSSLGASYTPCTRWRRILQILREVLAWYRIIVREEENKEEREIEIQTELPGYPWSSLCFLEQTWGPLPQRCTWPPLWWSPEYGQAPPSQHHSYSSQGQISFTKGMITFSNCYLMNSISCDPCPNRISN